MGRDGATWGPKGALAPAGSTKKKGKNRYKKLIAPTHIIFGPLLTLFLTPSNRKLAPKKKKKYNSVKIVPTN